ncbi:capsular exopolysaccharide family [Robiginitalea myxolifaciens]|uniref:non-specific protein-tyrosine kinase n=1 Tax=Robiginitalea myxolifaciens TaxID=400055 RepID=A0A1I6FN21_9FLAO|nr:polysaccharide biosynthesis tyrosine autokinase [Robiginitalea myxolifaciens]SFR31336.1 capsular exopolysaccharide family [Robiginitalea myxolifaciens]
MAESTFEIDLEESGQGQDLKSLVSRYLKYWPWFVAGVILCVALGFLYMRYAPVTYESTAKIEILNEEEGININSDALSLLGTGSSINMENEMEVLHSYRILRQVVVALNLDVSYYQVGNVKTTEIWNPPFAVTKLIQEDSLQNSLSYTLVINGNEAVITDENERSRTVAVDVPESGAAGYPFDLVLRPDTTPKDYADKEFKIVLMPLKQAVMNLAQQIRIEPVNKNSEILALSIRGESVERSESILNELIAKFNQDGIADRQLVSKRTLDFIDERFVSLSQELDSIEVGKEDFKRINELSEISSDVDFSIQQLGSARDEATQLETQVSLANLLKKAVTDQSSYDLLPVDVGLENSGLNSMVAEYNQNAIERERLSASVGANHPTLISISNQMQQARLNILKTINIYQTQLRLSLRQLNRERSRANTAFSSLPEKEKILRSIERQQSIKENLFVLLLQKREEAALNYAVTAPSIKVIDYALTDSEPLSPKKRIVYPMSLMLGMFVPFIFLYLRFSLSNKVEERADLVKIEPAIPIIGEIPSYRKGKEIIREKDRTVQAESFRILSTNLEYLGGKNVASEAPAFENASCILVTSAVKGEGKSSVALNLALASAEMNKRVLLIGADLRNPGLAKYVKPQNYAYGLGDYLTDSKLNTSDVIIAGSHNHEQLDICLSGKLPENPVKLLSGLRFGSFIREVSRNYDLVILDTAPCMSVADTLQIARYADATLFVVRAGYSDKNMVKYSRELHQKNQLPQMAYVLNDMGSLKSRKY